MPDQEKPQKEHEISDLDSEVEKFGQGPGVEVGVDRDGRQGEGQDHDQQI